MKHVIIHLIVFCTAQWSILEAQTIAITNPTAWQRQELVSIDVVKNLRITTALYKKVLNFM